MPELRRMQEKLLMGKLFGRELTVNEIIAEIRQGTATNFVKLLATQALGNP